MHEPVTWVHSTDSTRCPRWWYVCHCLLTSPLTDFFYERSSPKQKSRRQLVFQTKGVNVSLSNESVRKEVWQQLVKVAVPNAFFRLNFAECIPDFVGSGNAVQAIRQHPRWRASKLMFLTPDDISALRVAAYEDGKRFVIGSAHVFDIRKGQVSS